MKNPHGIKVSKLYDTDLAQIMHIQLNPGESLVKHITPVDAVFYVLEGEATITVGEEIETVSANNLVKSPKKIPHNISNQSDTTLRVMVIKLPKPTEATIMIKE
jgi:mannose-6-phosphate isomerase-like protein (cupin superfamily)